MKKKQEKIEEPGIDEVARTVTLRLVRAAKTHAHGKAFFDHLRSSEGALIALIRAVVRDMKEELWEP